MCFFHTRVAFVASPPPDAKRLKAQPSNDELKETLARLEAEVCMCVLLSLYLCVGCVCVCVCLCVCAWRTGMNLAYSQMNRFPRTSTSHITLSLTSHTTHTHVSPSPQNKTKSASVSKSGSVKLVSPEERDALVKKFNTFSREWRKRRRSTEDVVGKIAEGMGVKVSVVRAQMGLETDDDVNVDMAEVLARHPPAGGGRKVPVGRGKLRRV
jgi:hypothetical protein